MIQLSPAAFVFGLLMATAYGAGFHLFVGGPLKHIFLYWAVAGVGFVTGHFVGDYLGLVTLRLGVVHFLTASVGAWTALIVSHLLVNGRRAEQEEL